MSNYYHDIGTSEYNPSPSDEGVVDIPFTESFPLVQLVGNHRIVLEHYSRALSSSGRYEVR